MSSGKLWDRPQTRPWAAHSAVIVEGSCGTVPIVRATTPLVGRLGVGPRGCHGFNLQPGHHISRPEAELFSDLHEADPALPCEPVDEVLGEAQLGAYTIDVP
jgi:hypothetical protein